MNAPAINQALNTFRRRWRSAVMARGVSLIVLMLIPLAAGLALLDWWQSWPAPLRALLGFALLFWTAHRAWRLLWRPLQLPVSDQDLALVLERRLPELQGRLISATEGIDLGPTETNRLAATLAAVPPSTLLREWPMWQAASGASLCLIVVLGLALWQPHVVSIAVGRIFTPWQEINWPRHDSLALDVERTYVAADEPVIIRANLLTGRVTGLRLSAVPLTVIAGDTPAPRRLGSGPTWRETWRLPVGRWQITASGGDAVPVSTIVTVIERPVWQAMSLDVTPPAYANLPAQHFAEALPLTVLPGTTVKLTATPRSSSTADSSGTEESPEESLQKLPEGAVLQVALEIQQGDTTTTTYSDASLTQEAIIDAPQTWQALPVIRLPDGSTISANEATPLRLSLRRDEPPVVGLTGVTRLESVTPNAVLPLLGDMRDDFGLANARLAMLVENAETNNAENDQGQQTSIEDIFAWPIPENAQAPLSNITGRQETTRKLPITVADHAGVGSRIFLVLIAEDANDITGPGVGHSATLSVQVVSAESLRQELDRTLLSLRDRVAQARGHLNDALRESNPAPDRDLAEARLERTQQQLAELAERWQRNALDTERGKALDEVSEQGLEALASIRSAQADNRRAILQAEAAVAALEHRIRDLLNNDDLARELVRLIERQQALHEATKTFIQATLAGIHTDDQRLEQDSLASRQEVLVGETADWTRRLLSSSTPSYQRAQDLIRRGQPAAALREAAQAIAAERNRSTAINQQRHALKNLRATLAALQGADAGQQLARALNALAAQEERAAADRRAGLNAEETENEWREEQQELAAQAEALANQAESDQQEASAELSRQAAEQMQQAAEATDPQAAAEHAEAAAALLRQAARQAAGEQNQNEQNDQDNQPSTEQREELLALLRDLIEAQQKLWLRSQAAPDPTPRLPTARLAKDQDDIFLQLTDDAGALAAGDALAEFALQAPTAAVERATRLLEDTGHDAAARVAIRRAFVSLERLLGILDTLPPPIIKKEEGGGGEGGQQQQQQQANPYPSRAAIALLEAMQAQVQNLTRAGLLSKATTLQDDLRTALSELAQRTRPGTRPAQLLQRAARAMASSADLLANSPELRGVLLAEHDAARQALWALLEEIEVRQGQSGNSSNDQPPHQGEQQPDNQDGQQPPPQANDQQQGQDAEGDAGSANVGQNSVADGSGEGGGGNGDVDSTNPEEALMHLPAKERERILRARAANLPPESLRLYLRFLELLEAQR
jgi:hypothetical protein